MEIPTQYKYNGEFLYITIENIQTAYKWYKELKQFDLIVFDETHELFTPEYGKLLINSAELGIKRIGLSGTPDYTNKKEYYNKYCPIIYKYKNAEKDNITNSVNVFVYKYDLTDEYKVLTGTKTKQWLVGEKKQYEYLSNQYLKAKKLMFDQGAEDYFQQSLLWMRNGNKEQKEAATKFFYATKNRKEFLWNLNSSIVITKLIKNKILKAKNTKVLLFSQLTNQADKLSPNVIHSNVHKNNKQAELLNKATLEKFNKGKIRDIASCNSLTTGVSLVGCNWMIVESFNSSNIKSNQIKGRGRRLHVDDEANMVVIVPKDTQAEQWFNSAFGNIEYKEISNINEL